MICKASSWVGASRFDTSQKETERGLEGVSCATLFLVQLGGGFLSRTPPWTPPFRHPVGSRTKYIVQLQQKHPRPRSPVNPMQWKLSVTTTGLNTLIATLPPMVELIPRGKRVLELPNLGPQARTGRTWKWRSLHAGPPKGKAKSCPAKRMATAREMNREASSSGGKPCSVFRG